MQALDLLTLARNYRKNPTPHEDRLWQALRNRNLNGMKFVRQFPVHFQHNGLPFSFIADFCCRKRRLIIEVDGWVHENEKERDALRDALLTLKGFTVIRFTNTEIEQNLHAVSRKISES